MKLKSLKAISYIEIILVLSIIGIVSAISLPVLKKHSQRTELGGLAQKAFLTLNEVIDNSILLNGPSRNWSTGGTSAFNDYFAPSFNYLTHNASGYSVTTKDKMVYTAGEMSSTSIKINVDVNGSQIGPNATGKDIHNFVFFYEKGLLSPVSGSDTEALAQNGWRFSDELWNK